jgi:hypothetical protein
MAYAKDASRFTARETRLRKTVFENAAVAVGASNADVSHM